MGGIRIYLNEHGKFTESRIRAEFFVCLAPTGLECAGLVVVSGRGGD